MIVHIEKVSNGWIVQSEREVAVFKRVSEVGPYLNGTYGYLDIDADAPELPLEDDWAFAFPPVTAPQNAGEIATVTIHNGDSDWKEI